MKIKVAFRALGFLFLSVALMMSACKKSDHKKPKPVKSVHTSNEDSLKFYTWYYMESDSQHIPEYYWYDQVPDLDPFDAKFANADSLLSYMMSFTSEDGIKPVDRYSFLDRQGVVSGEIEGGQLGDKGFDVRYAGNRFNDSTRLFVIWTYSTGPAGLAGVQRGWEITAVNGDKDIMFDGPGYFDGDGSNVNKVVNALYYSKSATFTFRRPGAPDTTIDISNTEYNFNPVLMDSIYTVNGSKVGYIVFNSFVSVYNYDNQGNQTATPAKAEIDQVFDKFQSAGIKDLIVDLRYNGGGAVNTAEYLDNLIAPASQTGQIMYSYKFNAPIENYYNAQQVPLTVKFNKQGNLALDHVIFIVAYGTVSASELTINNLKPVMDVKLVGSTTYGKPVGFTPESIYVVDDTTHTETHMADLYDINFETTNQNGVGGYFKGMNPDHWNSDRIDVNWGDMKDSCLLQALHYAGNGTWAARSSGARLAAPEGYTARKVMNRRIVHQRFNGMVETRFAEKK